ncbi:hypothetical protein [Selenihalanaerobacter shriftii]|uniref:Uncharacterized protein n=1 Tax=Selenihalanaerobacter shriftii TaxID=142842 RepID=A0A1T4JKT7_9FIRM|nr:hypothetical protein [Selenihalanaerobacter shriftii]SJZ30733.1 hypothetical protein SAMN02745118_00112 [Selenihalanaerobacter shriftii]
MDKNKLKVSIAGEDLEPFEPNRLTKRGGDGFEINVIVNKDTLDLEDSTREKIKKRFTTKVFKINNMELGKIRKVAVDEDTIEFYVSLYAKFEKLLTDTSNVEDIAEEESNIIDKQLRTIIFK